MQEKVVKGKSDQKSELEELDQLLVKQKDEAEKYKQDLAKQVDVAESLSKANDTVRKCSMLLRHSFHSFCFSKQLKQQISDLTELVSKKEDELQQLVNKPPAGDFEIVPEVIGGEHSEELNGLREENKVLKAQLSKLNDMLQIANHSYHEQESKKIQELESCNGKSNGEQSGGDPSQVATNGN